MGMVMVGDGVREGEEGIALLTLYKRYSIK